LQDDRNLVIYGRDDRFVWDSGTAIELDYTVCMTKAIPGVRLPLDDIDPLPDLPGRTSVTISIFPPVGTPGGHNAFRMTVEPPGRATKLHPQQMRVGLINQMAFGTDLRIRGWNACHGEMAHAQQMTKRNDPTWMPQLTKGHVHTLVFAKEGWLGAMEDIMHIEPDRFWPLFGGKILTFEWIG
jgi:hypothetical protein